MLIVMSTYLTRRSHTSLGLSTMTFNQKVLVKLMKNLIGTRNSTSPRVIFATWICWDAPWNKVSKHITATAIEPINFYFYTMDFALKTISMTHTHFTWNLQKMISFLILYNSRKVILRSDSNEIKSIINYCRFWDINLVRNYWLKYQTYSKRFSVYQNT
jgi:hypothetical protein